MKDVLQLLNNSLLRRGKISVIPISHSLFLFLLTPESALNWVHTLFPPLEISSSSSFCMEFKQIFKAAETSTEFRLPCSLTCSWVWYANTTEISSLLELYFQEIILAQYFSQEIFINTFWIQNESYLATTCHKIRRRVKHNWSPHKGSSESTFYLDTQENITSGSSKDPTWDQPKPRKPSEYASF